jgi:hypothetical protein
MVVKDERRPIMAKKPKNSGKPWSAAEVRQLKTEIKQNTPTRVMGLKHGRTPGAVQSKANDLGLSTKPTNQSPYGTKGKRRK